MKKIISIILIITMLAMMLLLSRCNKQIIDLNYHFNYAIIQLPNGEIVEGSVQSWTDFKDGDQIQVKIRHCKFCWQRNNLD